MGLFIQAARRGRRRSDREASVSWNFSWKIVKRRLNDLLRLALIRCFVSVPTLKEKIFKFRLVTAAVVFPPATRGRREAEVVAPGGGGGQNYLISRKLMKNQQVAFGMFLITDEHQTVTLNSRDGRRFSSRLRRSAPKLPDPPPSTCRRRHRSSLCLEKKKKRLKKRFMLCVLDRCWCRNTRRLDALQDVVRAHFLIPFAIALFLFLLSSNVMMMMMMMMKNLHVIACVSFYIIAIAFC